MARGVTTRGEGERYVDVAALADLPVGEQRPAVLNGRPILLCRIEDEVYALADLCPHLHQPLGGGGIEGRVIRCPRHGARFDIPTGKPVNGVTTAAVTTYRVRIHEGRVLVEAPPAVRGFLPNFAQGGT